ncbi:PEGA domain-containing protein [Pontiellaceae bacterium B12219]|nr:PEGA domain-containing protein [Pontiellaceae bacterium B12219]
MKKSSVIHLSLIAGFFLSLSLTGCAPVTLSSEPAGASVYIKDNDHLLGKTPLRVNLVANAKELVVRKSGYFSKTVVVSPIDPESINVQLVKREKVLLLSNPEGAELAVEGVGRVGRTPYRIDYDKPWRTFEVSAPGYASRSFTLPEDPEGDIMVDLNREDTVLVTSNPHNAEVFTASGQPLGTTPLAVPAEETRQLELRKEGYYSKSFEIDKDTSSPFMVEMEREPIVIVYSEPAGAEVVHRGVSLGRTPFRQLVKDDMDIELKLNRYETKNITIAPDSPREVNVELNPMPYVTIRSKPAGAELYRSGGIEFLGTTPVEVLVDRDTAFEMHKDGYDIKPFTLSSQSKKEVVVPLKEAVGILEKVVLIDSTPSGAKVYRPGGAEFIGKTPLEQHVRGERTFELQLDGFKTKIVTVAPDSADSVVFALAKDESARNVTVSDPLLNTPSSF